MISAVVLLSGGLDSSYNLYRAKQELDVALALTFDYGQKAASREIRSAQTLCRRLNIPHLTIQLPWFRDFTATRLVASGAVPIGTEVAIDDLEKSMQTMRAVWVPNRNGIFLNIAAAYAEGKGAGFVVPGFNAEEAATFPDNSQGYLDALNRAFAFSTMNGVTVKCFSTHMNKSEILRDALALNLPLADLWPCYNSGDRWCGQCESCQRFRRAAGEAGAATRIAEHFV